MPACHVWNPEGRKPPCPYGTYSSVDNMGVGVMSLIYPSSGSSQEPCTVLEGADVRIIKAKVKINSPTLRTSLVSEGIARLLETGPHLKGK